MKYRFISICASFLLLFTSCSAFIKNEPEIEKIADDVLEEIIEDLTKK